jgi:hypothetical protein
MTRPRLIPLPCMAEGPAPTLREFQEDGERLVAQHSDPSEFDPGLLAALDRAHAQERDALQRLEPKLGAAGMMHHDGRPRDAARTAAVGLALIAATMRHVEARCPHIEWPPPLTGRQIIAVLSARAAACNRGPCLEAVQARWHDDKHCELCENTSDTFALFVVPSAPWS